MDFKTEIHNGVYTFFVEGHLDTFSAPVLNEAVVPVLSEAQKVIFDFEKLEYLSSAGIRVVLSTYQTLTKDGKKMLIRNASEEIMGVFKITKLDQFLDIE